MSLILMTLPLLLSLSAEDWLRDDRFPNDPLVGRFRVVEFYPRPLRLLNSEIEIRGPLLHLGQRVTIEHVGEGVYFSQPAQTYRVISHGLPLSAAADNAGLPPPMWQDSPQETDTGEATVIGFEGGSEDFAAFGGRPGSLSYIAAFGQPGPEAELFVTDEGDLIWKIFVRVVPVQGYTTAVVIAFRLKREG
jgi:hypothetical protein